MVFCSLSRGTAHNHQYAIPHEGLLVLLGQSSPGPLQCSTLCFAWDTNSGTCKQYHWQKQQVLVRADSSHPYTRPYFVMKSICPWVHPDQRTDLTQRRTGRGRDNTFPYKSWEKKVSQAHPKHIHRLRCTSESLYSSWTTVTDHKCEKTAVKYVLSLWKMKPVRLRRHKPQ